MSSIISQLNAALGGSGLQFSNPSGTTLNVVGSGNATVNAASTTTTASSLTSGNPQLPLFTDGNALYTGAITASGSQMTGYAGRITVNPALLNNASDLSVYNTSPATAAGDTTRSDYLFSQLTNATFSFSPQTGLGSAASPSRARSRVTCSNSSVSRATPRPRRRNCSRARTSSSAPCSRNSTRRPASTSTPKCRT